MQPISLNHKVALQNRRAPSPLLHWYTKRLVNMNDLCGACMDVQIYTESFSAAYSYVF